MHKPAGKTQKIPLQQAEEWRKLGFAEPDGGRQARLPDMDSAIDARMVDTKFFDESFKARLLRAIPNIDKQCDGVLIHSENFQAIGILEEQYRSKIDYIYIDPPYNSKTSRILYKNTYMHSAWISLINDRLQRSLPLNIGPITIAIDENEQENLGYLLNYTLSDFEKICICIIHNKKGIQGEYFSTCHEYAYFMIPENFSSFHGRKIQKSDWEYTNLRKWSSESARETAKNCFYPIYVKNGHIVNIGDVCLDTEHPTASNVDIGNGVIAVYPIESSTGIEKKWRYARNTVNDIIYLLKVVQTRSGELQIHKAVDEATLKTVWNDSRYIAGDFGTKWLTDLNLKLNDNLFPKSLFTVLDSISSCTNNNSIILDYFAGSGTTAHAVIALNREDGGKRKYILVEMAEHFDTVLKPRIEKVVYSPEWRNGQPTSTDKGISHCFKYMTLESYEDALGNIEPADRGKGLLGLVRDEYLLHYMLDLDARASLINTDSFKHPFDYCLKIAVDAGGATEKRKIDLIETFNYLIGLTVQGQDRHIDKGYVFVDGTLPNGDAALVIWRDVEKVDNAALNRLLEKLAVNPGDTEYAVIFVNGDHAIPNRKLGAAEGAPELKIRQLENVFLQKMFAED